MFNYLQAPSILDNLASLNEHCIQNLKLSTIFIIKLEWPIKAKNSNKNQNLIWKFHLCNRRLLHLNLFNKYNLIKQNTCLIAFMIFWIYKNSFCQNRNILNTCVSLDYPFNVFIHKEWTSLYRNSNLISKMGNRDDKRFFFFF